MKTRPLFFHRTPALLTVGIGLLIALVPAHARAGGADNTVTGVGALPAGTNTGSNNTADGFNALHANTGASFNTAIGFDALLANKTGAQNVAVGANALQRNTSSGQNTAVGVNALQSNTSGGQNTATGNSAMAHNTTGNTNTATGIQSLFSGTSSFQNTATGSVAMYSTTTGGNNIADGYAALYANTGGNANTALGVYALSNSTTGDRNIAVGFNAGAYVTNGSDNIEIGSTGGNDSGVIRLGSQNMQSRTFIAGISGTAVSGVAVVVDDNGQLGVAGSSERFKNDVQDMSDASRALLSLRPVSFRYKHEIDPEGAAQYGLIAEEVEKVDPALVAHDKDGHPYTVRYEKVNAMLLNEFLKEHARGQAQGAAIARLEAEVSELRAAMKDAPAAPAPR